MKEQFIPYELALKLKELGFDEECLAYWDDDLEFELNHEYLRGSQMDESWLTAPLWQQAFDWFREQHGLYSYLNPFLSISGVLFKSAILNQWIQNDLLSYEEARLECLKKLIEIYKNAK